MREQLCLLHARPQAAFPISLRVPFLLQAVHSCLFNSLSTA